MRKLAQSSIGVFMFKFIIQKSRRVTRRDLTLIVAPDPLKVS